MMRKSKLRSCVEDGLFVLLVMVAAMASAALEVDAVLGAVARQHGSVATMTMAGVSASVPARPASAPSRGDGQMVARLGR